MIASAAVAYAQAVFSVEEISYVEYADAEKEYSRYNVIPADTIPDNEIVNMVEDLLQARAPEGSHLVNLKRKQTNKQKHQASL